MDRGQITLNYIEKINFGKINQENKLGKEMETC